MHPLVLGELACGTGYIDVQLLASVSLNAEAQLWARDRRLQESAEELGLAFPDA